MVCEYPQLAETEPTFPWDTEAPWRRHASQTHPTQGAPSITGISPSPLSQLALCDPKM